MLIYLPFYLLIMTKYVINSCHNQDFPYFVMCGSNGFHTSVAEF